jgi:hypothetical protein
MENLVCDLQTSLSLRCSNANDTTLKVNRVKNGKLAPPKMKKSRVDCCKLTESIVSQAVLSASSLSNLVRLKATNSNSKFNRTKIFESKVKGPRKIFKIQKTFRFRNYRLRCIRLRRESRQHYRHNRKFKSNQKFNSRPNESLFHLLNSSTKLHMSEDNGDEDSSSVDSSDNTNSSISSQRYVTTSISSASDNDLSLTECFKSTKFLNSSDPSKDDEEDEDTKDKKYLTNLLR